MKVTTTFAPPMERPIEKAPQVKAGSTSSTKEHRQSLIQSEKDIFFAPYRASGRPQGDRRTAEQIVSANPIFKRLPMSIPREDLYQRLGNWTSRNPDPRKRADAAFNAARVFNYIDGIKVKESARVDNTKGNGRIEGEYLPPLLPPFDKPIIVDGSEAALLKKFSQKGYAALDDHGTPVAGNNEKITTRRPTHPTGRPMGDTRSAEQIFNANPIVNRFVKSMAKHPYGARILNNLKAQTGDWSEANKNANSRANAAYNIAQVANYLDSHRGFNRLDEVYDNQGPGHLLAEERSAFVDFSNNGYAALPG